MKKQTNREKLETFLQENNWEKDRFGHWKKISNEKLVRIKMQATSCRVEKRITISGRNEWFKVGSSYFKDILFQPDYVRIGRITIPSETPAMS